MGSETDSLAPSEETFVREQSVRDLPTVAEMEKFFLAGVVGTKELRNWLSSIDPDFAGARDADVDAEIERLARLRQDQLAREPQLPEDDPAPTAVTREGERVEQ